MLMATSDQLLPGQKVVHTLPHPCQSFFFFFFTVNKTRYDQDMGSICKMFLIRLSEKEYKVLIAQSLHHHDVWIV